MILEVALRFGKNHDRGRRINESQKTRARPGPESLVSQYFPVKLICATSYRLLLKPS